MKILTSSDIDYDNVEELGKVFSGFGFNTVSKPSEGFGNARVDLTFISIVHDVEMKITIMVWVPSRQPEILRFRTILFDNRERDEMKNNSECWDEVFSLVGTTNENAFGFLSLSNASGITLDYSLTIEGGIANSPLCNTAKEIARIALFCKSNILEEISSD